MTFVKDRPTLSTIAPVVVHSPIVISRSVHPCFFLHGYERTDIEILEWIATTTSAARRMPFVNWSLREITASFAGKTGSRSHDIKHE
jgi:hypothetical protein